MTSRPTLFSILALLTMQLSCVLSGSRYPMSTGERRLARGDPPTYPKPADSLLYTDYPVQGANKWPVPRTAKDSKCYPPQGSTDNVKITRFVVEDQVKGTDGGVAFLTSGGVDTNQVCFYFKSQRGKAFSFQVTVHGYRFNTPTERRLGGFVVPADEVDAEEDDDEEKKKAEKKSEEEKKAAEKKKEEEKKAAEKKKEEEKKAAEKKKEEEKKAAEKKKEEEKKAAEKKKEEEKKAAEKKKEEEKKAAEKKKEEEKKEAEKKEAEKKAAEKKKEEEKAAQKTPPPHTSFTITVQVPHPH